MANSARIEELERKFIENPRRYFAPLANEFRKAGQLQRAIAICREFVPQQPAHMSGHIVFGQALFENGDYAEAQTVFATALQLDPENLIALRHLGDIARLTQHPAEAALWYRRVLEVDPRNEETTSLLASVEAVPVAGSAAAPVAAVASEADAEPHADAAGWGLINPEQTRDLPVDSLGDADETGGLKATPTTAARPALVDPVLQGLDAAEDAPPPADSAVGAQAPAAAQPAQPARRPSRPAGQPAQPVEPEPAAPPIEDTQPVARQEPAPEAQEAAPPQRAVAQPPGFVTETMAELYLHQGHREEALKVYRQLVVLRPGDQSLRDRVTRLEREGVGATAEPAAAPPPHSPRRPGASHRRLRRPPRRLLRPPLWRLPLQHPRPRRRHRPRHDRSRGRSASFLPPSRRAKRCPRWSRPNTPLPQSIVRRWPKCPRQRLRYRRRWRPQRRLLKRTPRHRRMLLQTLPCKRRPTGARVGKPRRSVQS